MRKIKGIKTLALEICAREGKKKQVDIAQVMEILGVMSDILNEQYQAKVARTNAPFVDVLNDTYVGILFDNGVQRHNKSLRSKLL
jgi:hypothetical protein